MKKAKNKFDDIERRILVKLLYEKRNESMRKQNTPASSPATTFLVSWQGWYWMTKNPFFPFILFFLYYVIQLYCNYANTTREKCNLYYECKLYQSNWSVQITAEKKQQITPEDIMKMLDKLYDNSIQGLPKVSPPITQLADDYLSKSADVQTAAKSFINYQIAKCTTSGFITGLGGLITLPIAIPANVSSVLYVQMRMIACLAHMGGYDTNSDQVQTLVYACLAGISLDQVVKQVGIKFGVKLAQGMVKKIPGKVLTKINQKVGFRFLTKFGTKGLINIGKAIPIVGGVISGGFDFAETKIIADRAYKMFILGDFSSPKKKCKGNDTEEDVIEIDADDFEVIDDTEVAPNEVPLNEQETV